MRDLDFRNTDTVFFGVRSTIAEQADLVLQRCYLLYMRTRLCLLGTNE